MDSVLLAGKYKILNKLGRGGFGTVFEVIDLSSGKHYAVKMEKIQNGKHPSLNKEIQIINQLKGTQGILNVYDSGTERDFIWVIIDLLGSSLEKTFSQSKEAEHIRFCAVMKIGIQIVSRLQALHAKGFIHRDIKPENFVFGLTNKRFLYLVDFGLCKTYINPTTKKQLAITSGHSFVGTLYFASKAAHQGKYQYRKDDLESVCYVLIYLIKGYLPWQQVCQKKFNLSTRSRNQTVGQMKCQTSIQTLCQGLPDEFISFVKYVFFLGAYSKPDYQYLKSLLKSMNYYISKKDLEKLPQSDEKGQLKQYFANKLA